MLIPLFSLSLPLSLPPPPLPTHPLSTLQHSSIQQRLLGFVAQSADRLGARGVHWRHIHWNGEPLFKEEWQCTCMYHNILYMLAMSALLLCSCTNYCTCVYGMFWVYCTISILASSASCVHNVCFLYVIIFTPARNMRATLTLYM